MTARVVHILRPSLCLVLVAGSGIAVVAHVSAVGAQFLRHPGSYQRSMPTERAVPLPVAHLCKLPLQDLDREARVLAHRNGNVAQRLMHGPPPHAPGHRRSLQSVVGSLQPRRGAAATGWRAKRAVSPPRPLELCTSPSAAPRAESSHRIAHTRSRARRAAGADAGALSQRPPASAPMALFLRFGAHKRW